MGNTEEIVELITQLVSTWGLRAAPSRSRKPMCTFIRQATAPPEIHVLFSTAAHDGHVSR